ncbi:MAG: site-2 protease family protein [Acidobacteriota bacterium]|nr:site-2 protease family protein [Acidobacteriota bacterium]MDE3171160.1 site-2 protease family protein [Acidobacteriota bacterium]
MNSQLFSSQFLAVGMIWYIVFLLSTVCHEGAHALVAHLGGDSTAFHGGQVSLNPVPHIQREPFGTVIVPWITYFLPPHWMLGWASAPYDPGWAERHPHRAAWMALAGPAANFALAGLAALSIRLGIGLGYFRVPVEASFTHVTAAAMRGTPEFAATFLSILFVLNILLGTFNLLPVPPLDGHAGVTALMSEDTARRFLNWSRSQGLGFAGLLLAWVLYDRVFDYIFRFSLSLLYPGAY